MVSSRSENRDKMAHVPKLTRENERKQTAIPSGWGSFPLLSITARGCRRERRGGRGGDANKNLGGVWGESIDRVSIELIESLLCYD
jgi:hypothetical protein